MFYSFVHPFFELTFTSLHFFSLPPFLLPFSISPLPSPPQTKDVLLVKTLLVFGADINQQGLNDFTPLDLAIDSQCSQVESVLLEHGAKGGVNIMVQKQHPSFVVGIKIVYELIFLMLVLPNPVIFVTRLEVC